MFREQILIRCHLPHFCTLNDVSTFGSLNVFIIWPSKKTEPCWPSMQITFIVEFHNKPAK